MAEVGLGLLLKDTFQKPYSFSFITHYNHKIEFYRFFDVDIRSKKVKIFDLRQFNFSIFAKNRNSNSEFSIFLKE